MQHEFCSASGYYQFAVTGEHDYLNGRYELVNLTYVSTQIKRHLWRDYHRVEELYKRKNVGRTAHKFEDYLVFHSGYSFCWSTISIVSSKHDVPAKVLYNGLYHTLRANFAFNGGKASFYPIQPYSCNKGRIPDMTHSMSHADA